MIWRWFWREWKTPSLLIVWLALTLAVACVLALGRISDRIENSMSYQSRELLAGDLVLRSSHPSDPAWLQEAQKEGLTLSQQISFSTMAYATEDEDARPQLVLVKAADKAYPLYGELITEPAGVTPTKGEILVAPRLLELLNLNVGDNIDIGDATLKVSGKLIQEPDSGFNPFQIAPRVLIAIEDAPLTGAIQLGSRLTYRDMFAGDRQLIDVFQQKYDQDLRNDQRWFTLSENNGAVGKTFQRAQQFLLLSVLLTLLLAIAAVVVSMTHYCRSRHQLIAVLKTLGAGRSALRQWIIGQWLVILIAAALLGSLLGLAFEGILMQILGAMLPKELPPASLMPWVWAIGTLFIIAIIVGSRPYYQLMATQPSRVLREDAKSPVWPLYYYLPIVILIVVGGLFVFAGVNPLLWSILAGIVVVAILLALIGWVGLWGLRHIKFRQLSLRLSVSRLLRQPLQTITQMSAFSLSFMLLALLILVRGDLLDRWQQQLPADSPNYFLINMNQSQLEPVTKLLAEFDVKPTEFNPVVLARLTDINDQSAIEWADQRDPNNNTVRRELSLTWQSDLAPANVVDKGTWPPKAGEVSIEQTVVKELGLKLGDKLTFNAGAQVFSATVSSIRTVDWESLRPNFYFIFSEESLSQMPATWLSSFHYEGDGQLLTQLSRHYPTINVLDTGAIITQIQQILQQVSQALEVMVVLVIFCGLLLLLAQIQVGMSQRERELVVYRTLGASKKLMRRTLWSEFALLGLMAGLAAAFGAEIALWLLQSKVFDFPWQPEWRMWVLLPLSAAFLLSICGGWLGLRLLGTGSQHRRLNG
ncbi:MULTISPECIES: putative ABC transporter permease subunit YbbP [Providencia]|uniref:ABC transporter permease n=1 Tax=Providencia huaxiensis TaxID=2027290 RepID=A0ABU2IUR2_9GAMM|nr:MULTISPECIES: putative ABC transporter permease subunit YbbP [Providencia]MBZ3682494.1 ABC transporter permease [Providencia rettgeri]AXH64426.1 ABC transporter permease [Providencia huaxiensis]MCG9533903.1 ABC transporter permease [Providencia huaxiensis]MDT0132814.1 ABC transporter permease [Providencia huaxiensis]MDT1979220.1 ABC transporter permease [Providencia huaxiensis]